MTDREIDRQIDDQTDIQTNRQMDRRIDMYRCTDRQTVGLRNEQIDGWTDSLMYIYICT